MNKFLFIVSMLFCTNLAFANTKQYLENLKNISEKLQNTNLLVSVQEWQGMEILYNIFDTTNKPNLDDIYGTADDAQVCGEPSFAKLLFNHKNINNHLYTTIKSLSTNITTVEKTKKQTTCRVRLSQTGTPVYVFYTIDKKYNVSFDTTQSTNASETLFYMAPVLLNTEAIKDLISKGADPYFKTNTITTQESTLSRFVMLGRTDAVKLCLKTPIKNDDMTFLGVNLPKFGPVFFGYNTLMLAISTGNTEMIKLLLSKGASTDVVISATTNNQKIQNTPLITAISKANYSNDTSIIQLLLQNGAYVNQQIQMNFGEYKEVYYPLGFAIINKQFDIAKILVNNGADIENVMSDETQEFGALWLTVLTDYTQIEFINTLLQNGANPNQLYNNTTLLSYANKHKYSDLSNTLSKYHAKENLELLEHGWCYSEYGTRRICGVVENNTDKTQNYLSVKFNLFDKDGYKIGSTSAYISELEPNTKWKFETSSVKENATKYKFIEID